MLLSVQVCRICTVSLLNRHTGTYNLIIWLLDRHTELVTWVTGQTYRHIQLVNWVTGQTHRACYLGYWTDIQTYTQLVNWVQKKEKCFLWNSRNRIFSRKITVAENFTSLVLNKWRKKLDIFPQQKGTLSEVIHNQPPTRRQVLT